MCDVCRVLCVICAIVLFSVAYCEYDNVTRTGVLNAGCVRQYYRIYISRSVPPREYNYFHETLASEFLDDGMANDTTDVDVDFRIVGGSQISIQEAPYMVLYGLYCGGTLIAPDWVMTAAHCTDKHNFVLAGSTFRSRTTKYPICAHFIHPLWKKTGLHTHDYDYQLVLLEIPIPLTLNSMPIAIGYVQDIQDGALVGVSGWGHTQYKDSNMQDPLRRVRVPVINWDLCRTMPLENYKTITKRMFCAGLPQGMKDSCQGDSGGPAVINGRLAGLVSFGVGCAVKDQPGVYSNVPLVRGWIRSVTGLPL